MRIKVETKLEGPGPSEAIVEIETAEGRAEELIIDRQSIENDTIEVGKPTSEDGKRALIELPRESTSGRWRVWVLSSALA